MLRIVAPTTALTLLLSACASSGPPPSTPTRTTVVTRPAAAVVVLTADDAAAIRAYYGNQSRGRGNGRGRNGGLPPGIAKNLARGKPLPPGIAKQYLPADLVLRLPAIDRGLEYVVVAGKLLLVEAATQVVREVLLEAVFG